MADAAPTLAAIRAEGLAAEKAELLCALRRARGNVAEAARILSRSRAAVYRMIEKHGLGAGAGGKGGA